MAPWLSSKTVVGPVCSSLTSLSKFLNQTVSCAALHKAMYSASVDDNAITDCFLELQETVQLPTRNTYPEVDLRESTQPAQSESEYPDNTKLSE